MKKDTIIAILAIACFIEFLIIFGTEKQFVSISIEEQAQWLRECDYDLDYEAIEKFADAWTDYVVRYDYDDY